MKDSKESLPTLAPRQPESNKGTYGRILIVSGSRGMSGAAILAGSSCLRGGAGLVRVAVPESILPMVAQGNPCYLTLPLPEDAEGRLSAQGKATLLAAVDGNDCVAVGPGLGRSDLLSQLLKVLLDRVEVPLVLDADGINAFENDATPIKRRAAPLVITPHPGEFARLLGSDVPTVQANRRQLATQFATDHDVIVVLKGRNTIVTDGTRVYENSTGGPGLATGGTGDVLTGLIAALIGQRLDPFEAAQLGTYLHGLAGDLAVRDVGEISLIASDLLDYLPRAIATCVAGNESP